MRALVQRVKKGSVTIDGKVNGAIGQGLVILLGITHNDTEKDADFVADKCVDLRIFEDENGKMNKSLEEINGEILLKVGLSGKMNKIWQREWQLMVREGLYCKETFKYRFEGSEANTV